MESICKRLLRHCLDGAPWPEALIDDARRGLATESATFFRVLIEPLGDLFEPRLCHAYVDVMSAILRRPELPARYRRVRETRAVAAEPSVVYVLSRITLGADVAVTSVLLDAAKTRFPDARIVFVGPRKNWELFAADPRIGHQAFDYRRNAPFEGRIAARPLLDDPQAIVLDPDSRLSQLGLLPVTPTDANYYFFESRAFQADTLEALPELASRWCDATLGVGGRAYVAPKACSATPALATVSLGVGENIEKRLPDPFEQRLLDLLPDDAIVDLGASPEESERVRRAAAPAKRTFQGPFADFAWLISRSRLYAGYDSAGMHVAAACGVPLLCVFAGAISERFFARWRPTGPGPIRVIKPGGGAIAEVRQAIVQLSS